MNTIFFLSSYFQYSIQYVRILYVPTFSTVDYIFKMSHVPTFRPAGYMFQILYVANFSTMSFIFKILLLLFQYR